MKIKKLDGTYTIKKEYENTYTQRHLAFEYEVRVMPIGLVMTPVRTIATSKIPTFKQESRYTTHTKREMIEKVS